MLREILNDCIKIIKEEGWNLPDNIRIKRSNDYYKDKPFSPSFVDRDTKTIYVMTSITDEDTIKRLVMHELIHLTDMKNYEHSGKFGERTKILNKKYNLNLPTAAEDLLDNPKTFKDNPGLKKQAYEIFSKNSGKPVNELNDKMVYKDIPEKITESYSWKNRAYIIREGTNYFPY